MTTALRGLLLWASWLSRFLKLLLMRGVLDAAGADILDLHLRPPQLYVCELLQCYHGSFMAIYYVYMYTLGFQERF